MLNCNAPSPSEMADLEIQKALIENLSENPLALYILGSAIGSGIITAEKALEALKKRVPPAVAMGCKLQKPSGAAALEQAPAFRMEDPLRTSRGGRKQNMGSARNILHSPLARVMIVLKMQLPEHMQVALLLLSYLPTTFDLQTALQILQPVMKDSVSVVASIIRTYLNCGLLHFNHREGTFSMQASVQMIIRCLMLFADNQSPLTRACSEAIKCILETCSTVLTRASALVANGAAVTGSFYLNHHIPLFWKVQFLAQDHVLDGLAGNWLVTYLKPMVEHPAVFIQHLPAAARASFCRAMAGAAGQIGSCKSRAITLWHLGQALMEDNQVEGAVGVLNRAVDALDEPQQASRLVAPSEELELTTNLLRSQLLCALAVCSCQLDDTPKARKQAEAAVGLQQHTLRLLAAAAAPDDATRGCREESARLQLVTGLLLRGLIELRESEFSAAVLFFKEALAVVPSGEQGDGGVSNTMLRLSAAANHSLAHAQGLGGDWAAACQTLKQAAEMWLEAGTAGSNAVCDWMDCAELMHAQGRKDTARDMLRRAVAVMQDRSCIDRIRMNELWTCFGMEGAGQLGSPVRDSAQPAQGGPLKFLARILRMLTRHECGSKAPVGPPGGLVERWRQSHMMSSLPCGWTGIQGWPLSVWCGFPVESKDFTGRLLMRSITISRTWAALESKFAVETYIRQQAESDLSQRNRKAVQKAPDPPTQPECSTAECGRKAAAGLPAEPEEHLTMSDPGLRVSSATGPSSNARRRRPVGRQSSGSLSHAKSPSIQPLGQSPLRSSSRMPLDICKEAIDENCPEDD
uniref:Uncharacterized protein n=1 Tax=Tetraselmis sp. GSL018 TaxID=582737 RepID=A0A061RNL5_9CHLO